ncbi:MAG: ATP-dependent helicase HrpB [Planctomycetota bacterium]|nr:ATP-dependent helicase HrpB [Planctomycetota bacterium]
MLQSLPIDSVMPEIVAAVRDTPVVLLGAPPGSGKTTRVPPALLALFPRGEIVVLEPRRLAARAAATRVAEELGQQIGGTVGFQVRGDRQVSKETRIRFVTEGVLVRRLVQDPFLDGVAVVVLDEFHERHLEGDLALAMLREVQQTVREDLRLCVMSATLDHGPLRAFMPGAREVHADGRLYPVRIVHEERREDGPIDFRVRTAIERALQETPGDVLVFLPGFGEIERCALALDNLARRHGIVVMPLHGRLEPRDQDAVLRPHDRRKVVLSTNVAESSLTIPSITAVIDTGLCRELRHDLGRSVDVLELTRISMASATQRTGRAGRTGPGTCYRLWTAGEERGFPSRSTPDLFRVDLAGPALLVRSFAARPPDQFGWFEAPPAAALAAADRLLVELGAVDAKAGQVTAMGRELLSLPMHPRLARVVLAGRELGCARAAATAATLLADVDDLGRHGGLDLIYATATFLLAEERGLPANLCRDAGVAPGSARQIVRARDRLLDRSSLPDRCEDALPLCLLEGFPDRVVVRTGKGVREGAMVGGRGIALPPAVDGHDLLLALRLHETGRQQRSQATVIAALQESDLVVVAGGELQMVVHGELDASAGRVVAVRQQCYRDLPLRSARGGELPDGAARELLQPLLQQDPWRWLGEQKDLRLLFDRSAWLRQRMPDADLPLVDAASIAASAAMLLGDASDLRSLRDADVLGALLGTFTHVQRQLLERHAPDRIRLPSGRTTPIDYGAEAGPTVRARMQELFGLPSVAALAGGRVPVVLELLAPNHRPVQVTTDLPSFWATVYPQVRRELARRYPRHGWPEDPLAAAPEARPQRRRRD